MRKISILSLCLFVSFSSFAQSWSLAGNAGTNPPTNFLGTTDNEPLDPNPANNSTTIDYSLPSGVGAAFCQIYALNGNIVTAISLPPTQGKSQVQLNTAQLAQGMYIYALVADGKVLDTKKLVVAR